MQRLRIRIVGGSLGGLFAAALLSQDGHDVKVYERSTHGLAGRGAGLLGQPDTFAILRAAGCEHVARVGVVSKERITFDRSGAIIGRVASQQMQISWDRLYRIFRSQLSDDEYIVGREVVRVQQDESTAELIFRDGSREPCDLVVGADGLASVVRSGVNGDASTNAYAGYVAWRGLFPEDALPTAAADLLADRFAFFEMPRSHIIGYLVAGPEGETAKGKRRYNWIWYRPIPQAELAAVLTDSDGRAHAFSLPPGAISGTARQALADAAEMMLPAPFVEAVKAEQKPFIQAIFDYEAPRMASGRVALLGDAAFVVRPHIAMGAAKAAGDAMALRRALSTAPVVEALNGYHVERSTIGKEIAAHARHVGAKLE